MWMKIDDGLHAHRKTRAVTKSHGEKDRDAAPMGLWVLAGSWAARNNRDGWVPRDELDRFDDDWEDLAKRLIHAGYWWPEQRDGEDGYGFNDWHEWNNPDAASVSGEFGNHVRWHVNKGVVKPDCEHCPTEPEDPEEPESIAPISGGDRPDDRPDIAPDSGGDVAPISLRDDRPESLTRTRPDPNPTTKTSSARADIDADFEAWYTAYPRKEARGSAVKAYRTARKKTDAATLLQAVRVQTPKLRASGDKFVPLPASWLNGERWLDEGVVAPDPSRPETMPPVEESWMRRRR